MQAKTLQLPKRRKTQCWLNTKTEATVNCVGDRSLGTWHSIVTIIFPIFTGIPLYIRWIFSDPSPEKSGLTIAFYGKIQIESFEFTSRAEILQVFVWGAGVRGRRAEITDPKKTSPDIMLSHWKLQYLKMFCLRKEPRRSSRIFPNKRT